MKGKGKSKKKNSNEKEVKVNSTQLVNISGGKNVKIERRDCRDGGKKEQK